MKGNSPASAVNGYLAVLRRTLSCVTDAVMQVRGGYYPGRRHIAMLADGGPVKLRGANVAIRLSEHYEIVPTVGGREYVVRVRAYHYALHTANPDAEIIAFHWHPHVEGVP